MKTSFLLAASLSFALMLPCSFVQAQNNSQPAEKWIGVFVGGLVPMVRAHIKSQLNGLPDDAGLMVMEITPESPAVVAGIERFDIVLRADGQPLTKPQTLQEMLNKRNFGTSVRLDLLHEGKAKTVYALVLERPEGAQGLTGRGGPGGRPDFFNKMNTSISFTDPDGNQQKLANEQLGDFMRRMREDEKYRDAVLKKGISFSMKAKPEQQPTEQPAPANQ